MKITSRLKEALPEDALLTRYVDIHSFLYFITQNKLRFARLDTFEDINEGISVSAADTLKSVAEQSRQIRQMTDVDQMLENISRMKQTHHQLSGSYQHLQTTRFACCWYMGEKESVAMWNLYSNVDSVAIRFRAAALVNLITTIAPRLSPAFEAMDYGFIEYADLSAMPHPPEDSCVGFLKDSSFRHEMEFRFLVQSTHTHNRLELEMDLGDLKPIDFTIISHPKMVEWKIRNLLNVLSCYNLSEKFQPSELSLKINI